MFIFAAFISMPLLTKVAIFGAVACGAWLLLDLLSQGQAARRSSGSTSSAIRRAVAAKAATARAASPSVPTA